MFEVRTSNEPDSPLQSLRGPLGRVVTGSIHSSHNYRNILVNLVTSDKNLHYQVEKFWNVGGFGPNTTLKTRTDGERAYFVQRGHTCGGYPSEDNAANC